MHNLINVIQYENAQLINKVASIELNNKIDVMAFLNDSMKEGVNSCDAERHVKTVHAIQNRCMTYELACALADDLQVIFGDK